MITRESSRSAGGAILADRLRHPGIEGVVAKWTRMLYMPGRRAMVRIRSHRMLHCMVRGFVPHAEGSPLTLVLNLYDRCSVLHHVGHPTVLNRAWRVEAARILRPYRGGRSFFDGRMPGFSRWSEQTDLVRGAFNPRIVCEVAVGNVDDGRFRHAAKLVRWRLDERAADCTYSQPG